MTSSLRGSHAGDVPRRSSAPMRVIRLLRAGRSPVARRADLAEARAISVVAAVMAGAVAGAGVLGWQLWRHSPGAGGNGGTVFGAELHPPALSAGAGGVPMLRFDAPSLREVVPLLVPAGWLGIALIGSWWYLWAVRRRQDRERYAAWDSEWAQVEPEWRRDSSGAG